MNTLTSFKRRQVEELRKGTGCVGSFPESGWWWNTHQQVCKGSLCPRLGSSNALVLSCLHPHRADCLLPSWAQCFPAPATWLHCPAVLRWTSSCSYCCSWDFSLLWSFKVWMRSWLVGAGGKERVRRFGGFEQQTPGTALMSLRTIWRLGWGYNVKFNSVMAWAARIGELKICILTLTPTWLKVSSLLIVSELGKCRLECVVLNFRLLRHPG